MIGALLAAATLAMPYSDITLPDLNALVWNSKPAGIIIGEGMKTIVTFTPDGRVVAGPGLSPDEASQQMLKALKRAYAVEWAQMVSKPADCLDVQMARCPEGARCTYIEEPMGAPK